MKNKIIISISSILILVLLWFMINGTGNTNKTAKTDTVKIVDTMVLNIVLQTSADAYDSLPKDSIISYDYDKLLALKDKQVEVRYKLQSYDESKPLDSQPDNVFKKSIYDIDKDKQLVLFMSKKGNIIEKKYKDILGPEPLKANDSLVNEIVVSDSLKIVNKYFYIAPEKPFTIKLKSIYKGKVYLNTEMKVKP